MSHLQAGLGIAPFNIPGWAQTQDKTPLVSRCLMLDDGGTRFTAGGPFAQSRCANLS